MSRYDEWAAHLDPGLAGAELDPEEHDALERINEVLADEALWSEPPSALRDRIMADVGSESGSIIEPADRPGSGSDGTVVPLDDSTPSRRKARARWMVPSIGAVAAAVVLVAALTWPRSSPETFAHPIKSTNPIAAHSHRRARRTGPKN